MLSENNILPFTQHYFKAYFKIIVTLELINVVTETDFLYRLRDIVFQ